MKLGEAPALDGGGCGARRLEGWPATAIDNDLADKGAEALSAFVSTNLPDRIDQATKALELSATVVPGLSRREPVGESPALYSY